jgi:branched-chain amino acid transport system ATP-binding protein
MTHVPALKLTGVTKAFGGHKAVNAVNLTVLTGERRGIIGPNGAGKTTLFRCIAGDFPLTAGTIQLFGEEISRLPANVRVARGLGRTFQVTNVFNGLLVVENLILSMLGTKGTKFGMLRSLNSYGEFKGQASEFLELVGLADRLNVRVSELSHGERRQLEIAMALALKPKVLLLDEPMSGLAEAERFRMIDVIHHLPKDVTMVIIEHDMRVAMNLCDQVTCLHYGHVLAEGMPSEIKSNTAVREVYLGGRRQA